MIATASSSMAMMNVSRNWPSGIMGRISDPTFDGVNDLGAEGGAPCQGGVYGVGSQRFGYTPPDSTPGSDVTVDGWTPATSGRSCSWGTPPCPSASIRP